MTCSILVPAAVAATTFKRLRRLANQCGVELTFPSGTSTLYRRDSKRRVDLTRAIECQRLTVGELPRANGYGFVGKLIHSSAGNIISLAPGEQGSETPEEWRTCRATCDHCGTTRRRAETFIVRCPDGSIVRIGRNCLADFLAGDPSSFISMSHFQDAVLAVESEFDGDFGSGGGGGWSATTLHYLACAVSSIEKVGFFKRGYEGQCTADRAAFLAGRNPGGKSEPEWKAGQPTAAHVERAEAVIAWLKSNTDRSDYIHNLKVATSFIVAQPKLLGILASAPQAYNRALGQIAERAARAAAPDAGHVGSEGERLDFEVTITRVNSYESRYGLKRVVAMKAATGHELITFTTGDGCTGNDVGKVFKLRGTVKKHSEYEGRKQTELSRCSFTAAV